MWNVYIIECSDGTFYTGLTSDIERRIKQHSLGNGSKYVRSRLPFRLIYQERFRSKNKAMQRECKIKSLNRNQKEKLINK